MQAADQWCKRVFFSLILLSSFLCPLVLTGRTAAAQVVSAQITNFSVTTQDGSAVSGTTIMVGVSYTVHFTVEVAAGIESNIVLNTGLSRDGDHFWTLVSQDYTGVDVQTWQPGQSSISFTPVAGQAQFTLTGSLPQDYTTQTLENGDVLHNPKTVNLLELSLEGSQPLDTKSFEVIDQSIKQYRSTLAATENLLGTTKTDQDYAKLVSNVIDQAKAEATAGRTDEATTLLGTIPTTASGWAGLPKSESSHAYLFVVIGIVALLAIIALVLLLRGRSEAQFLKRRADDEARKLDLISAKINRIGETSIASEISRVKDSLDSISRGR